MNELMKTSQLEKLVGQDLYKGLTVTLDGFPYKIIDFIGDDVLLTEEDYSKVIGQDWLTGEDIFEDDVNLIVADE